VGAQTTLKADATQNGNGGKVIVWADDTTRAYGSISAQGGVLGGDGGFVEPSGHRYLDVDGVRVDTRALQGVTGNWLLDPQDLTILGGVGTGTNYTVSGSTIFTAVNNASSSIYADTISTALISNSVTINTGTGNSGDIVFDSTGGAILISTAGSSVSRTLTLNALGNIVFTGSSNTSFKSSLFSTTPISLNVDLKPAGLIRTDSSAAVTLDGTVGSAGTVTFTVPAGKTWDNHGILYINGNAQVHLTGGTPASFINHSGGTVNAASTTGFAFYSSSSDDGIISNDGLFNVTVNTAFEAAYSQTINGTLNIADGQNLNLQNAISLVGNNSADINLNATGILNINEYHGTVASLSNLTFAGTGGTLNVSGTVGGTPTATFSGVNAPNVTLNIGVSSVPAGNVTIAGNSIFKNVNYNSGTFAITNAKLGIAGGNFTVPAGVSYTGNVGYYAAGDLNITSNITLPSASALSLMAGWNPASLLTTPTLISSGVTGDLNVSALVHATSGMTVTAGHDIKLIATSAPVQLLTDSGDQNITAGHDISLTACASSCGGGSYADIVHGTGTGNQTIDLINGFTLTLTGGSGGSQNFARIDNRGTSGSIQKIWSSRGSGFYPTIVMNGGTSGGSAGTTGGLENANIAEIDSDISQQIYANTITMTGGAADYAGAIISAPTQLITTTGDVTLTGGSSTSTASGTGDTFTYKGVTYTVASPAAIGDKNNLSQTLTIGGTLTLNGGNGSSLSGAETSRMAMVGSLNGLATGSVKANAIVLNSGASAYSLAMLGGVKDIVVTSTFANSGVTSGFISGNAWSIWAPNPTAITGCGSGTGCLANFAQYGATYGSSPTILGTGHGWLYSDTAPALTATTSTNYSRVYDGTANAYLTAANFTVAGASAGDTVALGSITGNFANKNVGTAKAISISAASLSASSTSSIPVYGYAIPTISGLSADITQATLNWSVANATANTGTTPVTGLASLNVIYGTDAVTGVVSAYDSNSVLAVLSSSTPEGMYTEKVTGLTGADSANYSLASTGTAGVLTVNKLVVTPEVEKEVEAITSEPPPEDNQTKQDDDQITAPEKVLVALNFVDDPKDSKENPVETEKPKGRTLQCSVNK